MNPKLRRQLRQGLLPRKRRHRHPRLELCAVLLPLYAHVSRPLWTGQPLAYPAVQKSGAAALHLNLRRRLESWFSCLVHDAYASQEAGVVGIHCGSETGGIHLVRDAGIVEVLAEDGKLLNEGSGEMVVTNLTNWAMPFLRYRTGDTITLKSTAHCVCGQTGPMITELAGRDSVYVEFGGTRFNPSLLNPMFEALPIQQFQVLQQLDETLYIRVVVSDVVSDYKQIEDRLKTGVQHEIGKVNIHLEFVSQISRAGEKVQRYVRSVRSTSSGTQTTE